MSSLGLGEPLDDSEATQRVVQRFKQKLLPFIHRYPSPENRAWMKRTIMDFLWGLQRTEELPLTHPYMRVVDVEVNLDPHDARHVKLRFVDERGETLVVPI
jgi:hypothetical protein